MKQYLKISTITLILATFILTSCENGQKESTPASSTKNVGGIEAGSKSVILGETVQFKYWADPATADSLVFIIDGKVVARHENPGDDGKFSYDWNTSSNQVGSHTIRLKVSHDGKLRVFEQNRIIYPRRTPEVKSIEVVNTYNHDTEAYTQGLEFDRNKLYESTGRNGFSSLREVALSSGKVIRKKDLDENLFGEGLTIINDKIYQITWRSRKGFVYDLNTFELIREFEFNNAEGEGWGLTHTEEFLVMSDGSHQLYFYDTATITLQKTLEVYANSGAQRNLNELEYIDGSIYANVYGTNQVVVINPANGVITDIIDMSILRSKLDNYNVDVLNGIAYNTENKKLYVTGKLWPKLFEIKITDN